MVKQKKNEELHNISFTTEIDQYITGVNNCTANHLSRKNLRAFFSLHPQNFHHCTSLLRPLLQMLEMGGPDWTSQFRRLFSTIMKMV